MRCSRANRLAQGRDVEAALSGFVAANRAMTVRFAAGCRDGIGSRGESRGWPCLLPVANRPRPCRNIGPVPDESEPMSKRHDAMHPGRRRFLQSATLGAAALPVAMLGAGAKAAEIGGAKLPAAILALQPDGAGIAAQTMANGGARILGVSFGVSDLGRARRWVERGYERELTTYRGLSGESFLAPTRDDLGLSIEFHAMQPGEPACAGA